MTKKTEPVKAEVIEYAKLAVVLVFIAATAFWHAEWRGLDLLQYLESFVGVFFIVFALFKFYSLKEFAYGLLSYETMQGKSVWWGYAYPFIQVLFGVLYLVGLGTRILDGVVFAWSAYGAYVVVLTLRKKGDFHCLCLGNVIKLPLSTSSLVEDFGMATAALILGVLR